VVVKFQGITLTLLWKTFFWAFNT